MLQQSHSWLRAGAFGLCFSVLTIMTLGCGGQPETGTTVQDVEGQDEGMEASMRHMEAMMEGQQP